MCAILHWKIEVHSSSQEPMERRIAEERKRERETSTEKALLEMTIKRQVSCP